MGGGRRPQFEVVNRNPVVGRRSRADGENGDDETRPRESAGPGRLAGPRQPTPAGLPLPRRRGGRDRGRGRARGAGGDEDAETDDAFIRPGLDAWLGRLTLASAEAADPRRRAAAVTT